MSSPRRENASSLPSGESAASRERTCSKGYVSPPSGEKKAMRQAVEGLPAWSRSAPPTRRLPSGAHPERTVGSLWCDTWRTRIVAKSITNILFPPLREER